MLSAWEVMNRFTLGTYDELDTETLNKDLCHVLDLAINCFESQDPAAPSEIGPVIPDEKVCNIELHCNATTGDWNRFAKFNDYFGNLGTTKEETDLESFSNSSYYDLPSSFTNLSDYFYEDAIANREQLQFEATRYSMLGHFVTVGHAMSLTSLVIALTLLSFTKRLHCTRTYIHMNLMAAFMLRGLLWILHVAAFEVPNSVEDQEDGTTLQLAKKVFSRYNSSDLPQLLEWRKSWCRPYDQTSYYIWCRLYYVILNYSVTANYFWLLVEGIYLGLLLRTMNANGTRKKLMRGFLVLGWVLPWLPAACSAFAKLLDAKENSGCWFEDKSSAYWWIIKGPIILSLLMNFVVFILVIKVVGSKLKVNQRHRADDRREHYKWRLAKSTGALIPLLGIQYIATVFLGYIDITNPTALFVARAFEVLFISIEGLLVAVIYCFLNAEVQDECKRFWTAWQVEWEFTKGEQKRRKHGASQASQSHFYSSCQSRKPSAISTASVRLSTSVTILGRTSVVSEHSPQRTRCNGSNLNGIAESSPSTNGKMPHINGELASSLSENVFDSNKSLSSSVVNNRSSPENFNSHNLVDAEPIPFIKEKNTFQLLEHDDPYFISSEINEIYPLSTERDLFLNGTTDTSEIRESVL